MTNPTLINHRLQRVAQGVAARLPDVLSRRKLEPHFSGFYLTEYEGLTLLIAALDTSKVNRLECYTDADLIHQMSTEVGHPVYLSNHVGLRYVTLLSTPPSLPKMINLPVDTPPGTFALGVKTGGQPVQLAWSRMGHILTAGMTGSGKSVFLRSLVFQALRDGMQLLLADIDQATFPMLSENPALLAPLATSPVEAIELIEHALAECDSRAALFRAVGGYPEKLEQYNEAAIKTGQPVLPRVLIVLDEFSAVAAAAPAIKDRIAALGWRGRKFGLTVVFAAQEFTKDLLGPLRDQVNLAICFRVRSADLARRVNCAGAEQIPSNRPGLAYADRWGPVQTYFVDRSLLVSETATLLPGLTDVEKALFARAAADDGRLTRSRVVAWASVSEWQARRWMETWARRGWIVKDPNAANAFTETPRLRLLLSNPPTPPASANPAEIVPTVLQPAG